MSSYDALAGAYDVLTTDVEYQRRAAFVQRLFRKSRRPVKTVLDLACGTGTMACLLAREGYEVTATDASEEMLVQAARKAEGLPEEQRPLFVHQAMPRLRLPEPVDAVISTLDSLNYLTRRSELRETFRRVFGCLAPGGQFLFDVNTPYKLQRMHGEMWMDETEDTYCVWRTEFSREICTYWVDLFRLQPDGSWKRSWEEHRERAWSRQELTELLHQSGFSKIRVSGDLRLTEPDETADRWIFRCEKN